MANRFQQIVAPISYEGVQMYSPNFEVLNASLANLQQRFDTARQASNQSFQALNTDLNDRARILEEQQTRMSEIADIYSQDLTKGNQAVDQFISDIQKNYSPGGEAYEINKQVELYQAYADQVDEMFKSGVITNAEKVGWLKSASLNRFGGTNYDANTGQYNTFSGIDPTRDVDLTKMAIEIGEGWEQTTLARPIMNADGTPKLDSDGNPVMEYNPNDWTRGPNGYYRVSEYEVVKFDEVFQHVSQAMYNDPTAMSYLRQEADMLGLQDPNLVEAFMQKKVTDAAALISEKESRLIAKNQLVKDWQSAQRSQYGYDLALRKWELDQTPHEPYFSKTYEGVRVKPIGGNTIESLESYKDRGISMQMQAGKGLYDIGFGRVVNAYNQATGENLGFETPEDLQVLVSKFKSGELDPYIQGTMGDVSPGMYTNLFNTLEQGVRDERLATARLQSSEARFNETISDGDRQRLTTYQSSIQAEAQSIVNNNPNLNLSPTEVISLIEGEIFDKGDYSYRYKNGKIERLTITPNTSTDPMSQDYGPAVDTKVEQSYDAQQAGKIYEDFEKLANRRREFVNEDLASQSEREVDVTASNRISNDFSPQANTAEFEKLNELLSSREEAFYAIDQSTSLTPEEKRQYKKRVEQGLATVQVTMFTNGVNLDGNGHWVMSIQDIDNLPKGDEGIGSDPFLVPSSSTQGYMSELSHRFNNSGEAQVGKIASSVYNNGINQPYVDPALEGVVFMNDNNGNLLIDDTYWRNDPDTETGMNTYRVYTQEEGYNFIAAKVQERQQLRRAGISPKVYYEKYYPRISAVIQQGGNVNDLVRVVPDLTAQQLGIILYNDPNAIKATDQSLSKGVNPVISLFNR